MSQHQQYQLFQDVSFGDKLAFTVGSSYCVGFLVGLTRGIKQGIPKSFKMPKKLIMNNFFNTVGKQTSRLGNGLAGAGLLYYMMGGALNLVLEDELEEWSPLQKNLMCGTITGMIYKSTLGIVPTIVGGILGAVIIGGMTLLVEEGNKRGSIAFEMKF